MHLFPARFSLVIFFFWALVLEFYIQSSTAYLVLIYHHPMVHFCNINDLLKKHISSTPVYTPHPELKFGDDRINCKCRVSVKSRYLAERCPPNDTPMFQEFLNGNGGILTTIKARDRETSRSNQFAYLLRFKTSLPSQDFQRRIHSLRL